ncbi:hypothetical protein V5799_022539 [Amblyomma americanum]|uniref:Uncharacterized protein n=1 Tax=Amblyomma americanum TaxID=6943 RepID=A0AAQ4FLR5_AMBAM
MSSSSSQEQPLLKLDSVLSAEQVRALLQEAAQTPHNDKLDFDVLGNVAGTEDGNHSLAAIDDSFHDLENLRSHFASIHTSPLVGVVASAAVVQVLGQGPASGSLFAETSEAEVEALLKATLGADDLLSPIDLVLLDHCYCAPLAQLVAGPPTSSAGGAVTPLSGCSGQPLAQSTAVQETGLDRTPPLDEQDGDDAGLASPGSPQLPLRRSQRQIERIDRERLERIKAENAEQKRREQEEMVGRCTPVLGAESPQAPPPVPSSLSSPLMSPVSAAAPPPQMASPQPQQQQQQQPTSTPVRTLPATPKEKAHVVASPSQPSPARRGKVRNSESTSSTEGPPEDGSPLISPTRARKKRPHEEGGLREGPKKGSAPRKVGPEGAGPKGRRDGAIHKKGVLSRTEEDAVLAAREEHHHQPARRKSDDTDAKKRKHTPEPVSPFGKVVKVVRTVPEPKKRARRESFTDEPALFSQPDVLHKEHEPQTAPVTLAATASHTPVSTAASMTSMPAMATTPKPALQHSEESVYDSVEAHVARLAGGMEHGLVPATVSTPAAPTPTTPVVATPGAQVTGLTVPQHKPTAVRHGEHCQPLFHSAPVQCPFYLLGELHWSAWKCGIESEHQWSCSLVQQLYS